MTCDNIKYSTLHEKVSVLRAQYDYGYGRTNLQLLAYTFTATGMSITITGIVRMATGIERTIRMHLTAVHIFQVCPRSEGNWVLTLLVEQRSCCDKVTSLESQQNCKRGDFSQSSRLLRRKSLAQLVAC